MLEFSEQRCFAVFELSTIKKPHGIGFFCVTQCDSVVLSVKLVCLYHKNNQNSTNILLTAVGLKKY